MIICGASAYPHDFDYAWFRAASDINKSFLLCDMSHVSGLVAAQEFNNPLDYCDVVTPPHKTLRAEIRMIFYKKEYADSDDFSVFRITGWSIIIKLVAAHQLLEVNTEDSKIILSKLRRMLKHGNYLINKDYTMHKWHR